MSKPFPLTLRVLAHLLSYPDTSLRDHLAEMTTALQGERALRPDRLAELSALMQHLRGARAMDVEAHYVETFDRGRGTALHLFEHVHGDSRDRGPAMIDLLQTYEQAGLYLAPGELPDHLTVVLEYASTQPPAQARAFLRELTHILQAIFSALLRRESPYASVLAAVLELAGEKAQAVKIPDEPTLDESWEEPAVFGGCSTQGQASPGQPQPIQIVRAAARQASTQPGASA
ncbi:MAG TPA: nitrate reductase molybdenum cofactor assembly chaperone [Ottowia sp.]|jgi:nitrate reductase delta subunit|nr:nitrate reductase molybdenum cofactor assembly chaperone [Rubrivivax sp.]HMZ00480.1 nitrate reductase molybdenum cofactor assembly chaperone [Burkholderiaceae bacterium]HNB46061.1 nitrate reductase molybdenum cofactor assembly chaperone [Burkholderiaceae bacterium]HNN35209.1 nitrate reductase molybdenum cofactor assembly chaperone [Ottowia sp.]